MNTTEVLPPSVAPAPSQQDRTVIPPDLLVRVASFQFRPLIDRMIDKLGWSEEEATLGFEDVKRFLYLCGVHRGRTFIPSQRIDEVWHNFILFTEEYQQFCYGHFGRFIHHRPHRKDDPKPCTDMAVVTLRAATEVFGALSPNWMFVRKDGSVLNAEASSECGPSSCSGEGTTASCHGAE
ncbi:MAG TPA: hypothetical protein VF438_03720 [Candidatus Paceibacterota bacterium]